MAGLTEATLIAHLLALPEVETMEAMGYRFFFVGPDRMMPFATLINRDNEHDSVSNLDRPGVYRLNLGVSRETFRSQVTDTLEIDYTVIDRVIPHPHYAAQNWISILSPSNETWPQLETLVTEAHEIALRRHRRRLSG